MVNKEQIISVLVITYNHENFVKDCLESILCQKVDATIEILIGDDVISFMFIIHPLRYLHDLVIEGPIIPPSRKTIEKNLESLGLLGPEMEEDG